MAIVSFRSLGIAATAAAFLLLARPAAHAQSAEAESLFQQGKKLIKEGKLAEGCDKLEASDRIEPSVGTELNLADCREKNKQLATAWATFLKAAGNAKKAGNDEKREKEARARAAKLEPRLSYLTVSVPDASKVDGLTITRNGVSVDSGLWNQGVPVDEGEYEITGQAPGHEAWTTKVTISGEGDKESVEVPRFKAIEEMVPEEDPKKPKEVAVGEEIEEEDPDEVETEAELFSGPKMIAVRVTGGIAMIGAGALPVPVQASFAVGAGYPLAAGPVTLDLGVGLTYSPVPYDTMDATEQGTLLGVRATVGATYPVNDKIGVRGDLGLGITSLSGLKEGNPFTDDREAASFTMPSVRFGIAADYAITSNIIATISPFSFAFSPAPDTAFMSSLTEIDVLLGVGYRM